MFAIEYFSIYFVLRILFGCLLDLSIVAHYWYWCYWGLRVVACLVFVGVYVVVVDNGPIKYISGGVWMSVFIQCERLDQFQIPNTNIDRYSSSKYSIYI